MNYVTADDAVLDRLSGLMEPTEIRDTNGNVLGTYVPLISTEERALYERAVQLFDPAETERRLREEENTAKRPFSDVIKRLEALNKP